MKNLQAFFNEDANKNIEQGEQEDETVENLNFFIELGIISMVAIDKVINKEKPNMFYEA